MKKLIAILLACLMLVSVLAACGPKNTTESNDPSSETPSSDIPSSEASEPSSEAPSEAATEPSTEASGPRIVDAGVVNKHDLGWYQNLDNGTDGVYFNLWSNDVPADDTWAIRYVTTSDDDCTIIRDGVSTTVSCQVLKFSNTEYFLVLDPWLIGELSPLQTGDVIVLQGDLVNYDNGWGLHFDTTYFTLKGEDRAVISTNPPA